MAIQLLVKKGSSQTRTFTMKGPEMLIGRLKGCGLRIPAGSVSRRHCRLTVVEGILYVEDLESANGTLVNGEPVQSSAVKPGDLLTVGPITFLVQYPLTPAGVDKLLNGPDSRPRKPSPAQAAPSAEEDILDAIPLDESRDDVPRVVEMDLQTIPMTLEPEEEPSPLPQKDVHDKEVAEGPEKPRRKKKKKRRPAEGKSESANPDYSMMMKEEGPWQAPQDENLRDLLSQLEEEE